MRNRVVGFLLVGVLLVVASGAATAQIAEMKVNLPFAFQAVETQFPAGSYAIGQPNPNVRLSIRSQRGKENGAFTVTSLPSESAFAKDTTFLVFHKVDGKYYLSQVWSKHLGAQLPESQAVKEARSSGKEVAEVRVNIKM